MFLYHRASLLPLYNHGFNGKTLSARFSLHFVTSETTHSLGFPHCPRTVTCFRFTSTAPKGFILDESCTKTFIVAIIKHFDVIVEFLRNWLSLLDWTEWTYWIGLLWTGRNWIGLVRLNWINLSVYQSYWDYSHWEYHCKGFSFPRTTTKQLWIIEPRWVYRTQD